MFYCGELSAEVLIDIFIFYRYSSQLELHAFRNKPAHYIWFFMFCCTLLLLPAVFIVSFEWD